MGTIRRLVGMVVAFTLLAGGPTVAQEACSLYAVRPGDTLRKIVRRAYGTDDFTALYEANRDVIGPSPNRIERGTVLRLPCADGSLPPWPATPERAVTISPEADPLAPTPPAALPPASETAAEAATNDLLDIAVLPGLPPFGAEGPDRPGLAAELVMRILDTRAVPVRYRIRIAESAAAAFDADPANPADPPGLILPWFRPDCASPIDAALPRRLCAGYDFSPPLYTVEVAFMVPRRSRLLRARSPVRLAGVRLCVPEGYVGPDPLRDGLVPASVRVAREQSAEGCLAALRAGRADVILANPGLLPDGAEVEPIPALSGPQA
ncbi:MAG: hypothetical protein D6754_07065, partial [Alphaproteobacteria bacterium]